MTKTTEITGRLLAMAVSAMGAGTPSIAAAQDAKSPQPFYSKGAPDPSRWYHVIAGDPVADGVYARIANTTAERRDPQRLDTVIAYGPGNWTYEWEQEAEARLVQARAAEQAGDRDAAADAYLKAARMFSLGSSPHLRTDIHAMAALDKARLAYQAAQPFLPGTFRVLQIPLDGKTFEAYLHLPAGDGPFPVLVASNGSDVVKEEIGATLRRELALRGIALLSIDMPGIGSGGAYNLTPDSDKLHVAAIEFIRRDPSIDAARVAGMGISFGGHAAAQLFLRPGLGLKGVVESCGPLHSAFMLPPQAYVHLPPLTIDGVRDRVGLPATASATELSQTIRPFSLGAGGDAASEPIATPLLILATDADPVAPLDDIALLSKRGSDVSVIISREPGHCPNSFLIASTAAAWLSRQMVD